MPAKAAALAAQPQHQQTPEKLETIATALSKGGLFEKAGEFYEKLNMTQKAMASYRQSDYLALRPFLPSARGIALLTL